MLGSLRRSICACRVVVSSEALRRAILCAGEFGKVGSLALAFSVLIEDAA